MSESMHPLPLLDEPSMTVAEARRLVAAELSAGSRIRHTLLLLLSLALSAVVTSLAITEPAIPGRTRAALIGLSVIGWTWSAFFGWVITCRRVLLAGHRVLAARLAVTFSSVFTASALAYAWGPGAGSSGGLLAAALGGVMVAVAIALLLRARRRQRQLVALRDHLQQQSR